jgi:hypothetical protein
MVVSTNSGRAYLEFGDSSLQSHDAADDAERVKVDDMPAPQVLPHG